MKRIVTTILLTLLFMGVAGAGNIRLPEPDKTRTTLQVSEALAARHSVREFASDPLSLQDVSDLCWAACGINRKDGRRTAPTAMNKQEIRLFVFNADGVYEYLPSANELKLYAAGDHRGLVAGGNGFSQDFVLGAPLSLVMVIDFDVFGSRNERAVMMTCVDAGNVSENINLFCQATGLATVPRASMDAEGIRTLLGLPESCLPILNNPVGYPAGAQELRSAKLMIPVTRK